MAFKLSAPLIKTFTLERADSYYRNEGEPTTIQVAQATQYEAEARDRLFSEITRVIDDSSAGIVQLRQRWAPRELERTEVYLTLCGTNITDNDGNPVFRFAHRDGRQRLNMTEQEFRVAWGKLPVRVCEEIHEKVREVNVTWSGLGEEISQSD